MAVDILSIPAVQSHGKGLNYQLKQLRVNFKELEEEWNGGGEMLIKFDFILMCSVRV
jgi:hypothetical protein